MAAKFSFRLNLNSAKIGSDLCFAFALCSKFFALYYNNSLIMDFQPDLQTKLAFDNQNIRKLNAL